MKYKAPKNRKKSGKPAKRVSAVKKKRTGAATRQYLMRCWWILRGAAVGVLVLILFYGVYLGAGKVIRLGSLAVKVVEVDGCVNIQPETIVRLAGVVKGEPLLKVDLKKVRRMVMSHPSVKDATAYRELPNTLKISVKERMATAVVLGPEFALVDAEGVVLRLQGSYPDGYPVITGITEPLVQGRTVMQLRPAMKVLLVLTRSGLMRPERISELGVDGDRIRISLMEGGTVLLIGHEDVDAQIKKLARLMEAGVFDSASAGFDLRFEGRVIGLPERSL